MKKPNRDLKESWYKKLKESGFNDIEQDEFRLKQWDSSAARRSLKNRTHDSWQSHQEYYILAYQFLNNARFRSKLDKIIWEYHSNGISMRGIAKLLSKVNIKHNKDTVNNIVKRLRKRMLRKHTN